MTSSLFLDLALSIIGKTMDRLLNYLKSIRDSFSMLFLKKLVVLVSVQMSSPDMFKVPVLILNQS